MTFMTTNVKKRSLKKVIGDVVRHLKQQKFVVLLDLCFITTVPAGLYGPVLF